MEFMACFRCCLIRDIHYHMAVYCDASNQIAASRLRRLRGKAWDITVGQQQLDTRMRQYHVLLNVRLANAHLLQACGGSNSPACLKSALMICIYLFVLRDKIQAVPTYTVCWHREHLQNDEAIVKAEQHL